MFKVYCDRCEIKYKTRQYNEVHARAEAASAEAERLNKLAAKMERGLKTMLAAQGVQDADGLYISERECSASPTGTCCARDEEACVFCGREDGGVV